jgi:hypothetical protein
MNPLYFLVAERAMKSWMLSIATARTVSRSRSAARRMISTAKGIMNIRRKAIGKIRNK